MATNKQGNNFEDNLIKAHKNIRLLGRGKRRVAPAKKTMALVGFMGENLSGHYFILWSAYQSIALKYGYPLEIIK